MAQMYALDEGVDLPAWLEKHGASVEERCGAVIRMACKLPLEQLDESWALPKDLPTAIQLTRQQILLARHRKSPRE